VQQFLRCSKALRDQRRQRQELEVLHCALLSLLRANTCRLSRGGFEQDSLLPTLRGTAASASVGLNAIEHRLDERLASINEDLKVILSALRSKE
jgi:hypothetical protein